MTPKNLALSPDVFFFIRDRQLCLWEYVRHEQYEVSADHLKVLLDEAFAATRPDLVKELIDANILVEPAVAASRTPWSWDVLARIFHMGTSAVMTQGGLPDDIQDQAYLEYTAAIADSVPPDAFDYRRGEAVGSFSPSARASSARPPDVEALIRILSQRKSSRVYEKEPLALSELSDILSETFRYRPHDVAALEARGLATFTSRRSSPAGGSLQSCEGYLLALNVAGLDRGIYHYWSSRDELGRLNDLPAGYDLGACLWQQDFVKDLSALIVLTCRFDKMWWKYHHSRAYRVALLDCGHLSQTIQLLATAHKLQTWVSGAFYDTELCRLLSLTSDGSEQPLLVVGIGGHGAASSLKSHWKVLDAR